MILKMAYRNLFRHKKRTLLTIITMIVGVMLSVVADGTYSGLEKQVRKTYIETDIGLYKIYWKDFYREKYDNEKLEYLIEDEKKIDIILNGKKFSKRLIFEGSITNVEKQLKVTFIGSSIKSEEKVFNRSLYMLKGKFNYDRNKVVIGYQLANLLQLSLGDTVTIMARTARKSIDAYDVEIGGIIKTGNPILDEVAIFIPLQFAKIFADTDYINDITIGEELSREEIEKIQKLNVDFIPYEEELKEYLDLAKADKMIFLFMGIGILLMAGINIANTMLMAMLERRKEIGIMMANGLSRRKILELFLAEGTLAGLMGTGIGIILGSLIVIYYSIKGIPLRNMQDFMGSIPVADRLYMNLQIKSLVGIAFVGLIFSILAAYYPAHKGTKLNPVEAIRD